MAGGENMAKKAKGSPTPVHGTEKLKWETAKELGLDDDLAAGGDELTVREAGKIGGNMTKKLVEKGEKQLTEEDSE
jgi:Small, acid-soluble spore proteins, alpha/beta type